MYNTKAPAPGELPSSKQLLRSTLIAGIVAALLLLFVVLPAEYGVDPTGAGRMLGLTQMGEIKTQLAEEAAADSANAAQTAPPAAQAAAPATDADATRAQWRDELRVALEPGQGAEVKLTMKRGQQAQFEWRAEGGTVNFDLHGDGAQDAISYEKGRGVSAADGKLEAAFDGNHGWFWRNRGKAPVTVLIRARGEYGEMKRVL